MKQSFLLIVVVVALSLLLAACGANEQAYSEATALMEAGDYAAAAEAFSALGNYNDAPALAEECGLHLLKIQDMVRTDTLITLSASFDRAYSGLTGTIYTEVDNDSFLGTAETTFAVGDVESGQLYTFEIPLDEGFTYSGQFLNISISGGSFNINPPDMSQETYTLTIYDGETALLTIDSVSE
jgi:hypothetical protein